MNVTVNAIELACNLAHEKTVEFFLISGIYQSEEELFYLEDDLETTSYHDDVQDKFNEYYDYYFDIILNCSI